MKRAISIFTLLIVIFCLGCERNNNRNSAVEIPDFNFPTTTLFESKLSSYSIFKGVASNLVPNTGFTLLELSSPLFTDYAQKQRLIKVPEGSVLKKAVNDKIDFPDGTILTKTFFYYNNELDTALGKRIIETRLLIKNSGIWNAATYVWDQNQQDATLNIDGSNTSVTWINEAGTSRTINYKVPSENECIACHQASSALQPIGATLRNLNRIVTRNGAAQNQIAYLQSLGLVNSFSVSEISSIPNYTSSNTSLNDRGKAYLAMNCAHCHSPNAWDKAANRGFDFRYETPLEASGILGEENRISRLVTQGEMPFIGTSIIDRNGVDLIIEYLNAL